MLNKLLKIFDKKLIKDSGIYTTSSILERAIPFLLLPILTRYLTPEDYGIVAMFSVLIGITNPLTGLGIRPAILRTYYKERINFVEYLSSSLAILIASTIFVSIIFYFFSEEISFYSSFPENWLFTVVLVSVAQFCTNLILVIWQAEKKPFQYGLFNILITIVNLTISVLLIVGLGYGWEGRLIGKIVAYSLFGFFALLIIIRKKLIAMSINFEYIKHALGYGLPLIPHIFSAILITYIDRLFITNMVGIEDTGIYTVGYQIGMIVSVLVASFNKAWSPWVYENLNKDDHKVNRKIVKITYVYFVVVLSVAFLVSSISTFLMDYIVGKEFLESSKYILWIALAYAFNGMYYMVTCYIFYKEKTYILSLLTFISAILNIILNYFLIIKFGPIGAAVSTTLSFACLFLLGWIWGNKIHKMPWLLKKL